MRLLVVYGLKTADYGWLSGFYPARRLAEECEKRSVKLRFLFPKDVPEYLGNRDARLTGDTVCLIRGRVGDDTVRLLEGAGLICVNSSASRVFADDKLRTARFLETHLWPSPKTSLFRAASISFPCILKPRYGSRGEGVSLVETADDLAGWKRREFGNDNELASTADASGVWIAQEYIAASRGRDLRVFFAGGDILACVERRSADGGFLSNASTGGAMSIPPFGTELPEPWRTMVLDIAHTAGLWYGTVDFLYVTRDHAAEADERDADETDDAKKRLELTICEINSAPGFEALETGCGIDIAGAVIERLARDFGQTRDSQMTDPLSSSV
jgi:RimK family alpha-L-glutamate ligase